MLDSFHAGSFVKQHRTIKLHFMFQEKIPSYFGSWSNILLHIFCYPQKIEFLTICALNAAVSPASKR